MLSCSGVMFPPEMMSCLIYDPVLPHLNTFRQVVQLLLMPAVVACERSVDLLPDIKIPHQCSLTLAICDPFFFKCFFFFFAPEIFLSLFSVAILKSVTFINI